MVLLAFIAGFVVGGILVGFWILMRIGKRQAEKEKRELEAKNERFFEERQKFPVLFKVRDIARNSKDWRYPKTLFDELVSIVSLGADLDASDEPHTTPLLESIGYADVPEFLINRGASITATTKEGNTALHLACTRGSPSVAKLLIKRGAVVNAKNDQGATPLHCACLSGNEQCVELLIEAGADVLLTNNQGEDPLFWAARKPSLQCLEMLIERGANPARTNSNGETAFSIVNQPMKAGELAGSLPYIDGWMIKRSNEFNQSREPCAQYLKICIQKLSANN